MTSPLQRRHEMTADRKCRNKGVVSQYKQQAVPGGVKRKWNKSVAYLVYCQTAGRGGGGGVRSHFTET